MEPTQQQIPAEAIEAYNLYIHGEIDRRAGLSGGRDDPARARARQRDLLASDLGAPDEDAEHGLARRRRRRGLGRGRSRGGQQDGPRQGGTMKSPAMSERSESNWH